MVSSVACSSCFNPPRGGLVEAPFTKPLFPAKATASFGGGGGRGSVYFRNACLPTAYDSGFPGLSEDELFRYFVNDPINVGPSGKKDGGQVSDPGITTTLTRNEKLDIARLLLSLGFDIIEAGFPASSDADFETVKLIASEIGNVEEDDHFVPTVSALASCDSTTDIDKAWEAVKSVKKPRIRIFIPVSEADMEHKLKMTPEQVVERAAGMVAYARSLGCNDVEFTPDGAGTRSWNRDFLYRILGDVIKAGATAVSVPDKVAPNTPFFSFRHLVAAIEAKTPGIENVTVSTQCYNDCGLVYANTLPGHACPRQVKAVIDDIQGIGIRAGEIWLRMAAIALKSRVFAKCYCQRWVVDVHGSRSLWKQNLIWDRETQWLDEYERSTAMENLASYQDLESFCSVPKVGVSYPE